MKRMRILGLALVAVFAVVAITAAGASAAKPTWKACVKAEPKNTGAFSDKACSVSAPGTGKYNLVEGIGKGKGFKGKGGEASLHNVIPGKGDIQVKCKSFKDSGSVVAPSGVENVKAVFSKCTSLGAPCSSGVKKETIETSAMSGSLGYMNKAHTAAGESLTNQAAPHTGYLAQFECEGLAKVRVHGAVIGSLSPFGVVSKESTSTFAIGPYLGELAPGYTPLTNPPAFEEGAEPVGVLLTELKNEQPGEEAEEYEPAGGLPSGQEGVANNKGEALAVS